MIRAEVEKAVLKVASVSLRDDLTFTSAGWAVRPGKEIETVATSKVALLVDF